MGHVSHDAIIVTSWNVDIARGAWEQAIAIGLHPTQIAESQTNGYSSFLVVPDGSKDGWDGDEVGDRQRAEFIQWLRDRRYDDGSSSLEWVAVRYGSDDAYGRHELPRVTDSEWQDQQ